MISYFLWKSQWEYIGLKPFILRWHTLSDMFLGGSWQRAINRPDLCSKNNYNFLQMVQISYIFLRQWGIESLPYCWCETDFVRCQDGVTNSTQKGWKRLKYWIPHSLVRPPLTTCKRDIVCVLKVLLLQREPRFFRSGEIERRKYCSASWSLLLTDFFIYIYSVKASSTWSFPFLFLVCLA